MSRNDGFWLAFWCVILVTVMIGSARLLRPREPKRRRWLPTIAALLVPALLGCASVPREAPAPAPDPHVVGAGWSDLDNGSDPSPQPT